MAVLEFLCWLAEVSLKRRSGDRQAHPVSQSDEEQCAFSAGTEIFISEFAADYEHLVPATPTAPSQRFSQPQPSPSSQPP